MTRQLPLTGWNALELQQQSARVGLDCNPAPPNPTTTTEYVSPARDLGDQRIGWRRNRRLAPGQATMPMPPRR